MAQDFFEHVLDSCTTIVAASGIWLLFLVESDQFTEAQNKEADGEDGYKIGERYKYEHNRKGKPTGELN